MILWLIDDAVFLLVFQGSLLNRFSLFFIPTAAFLSYKNALPENFLQSRTAEPSLAFCSVQICILMAYFFYFGEKFDGNFTHPVFV